MLINDPWQGRGLGHLLLDKLIRVGYEEGIHRIVGEIMTDNWAMQALCQSLGFYLRHTVDEVRARLDLRAATGEDRAIASAVVQEARDALRR